MGEGGVIYLSVKELRWLSNSPKIGRWQANAPGSTFDTSSTTRLAQCALQFVAVQRSCDAALAPDVTLCAAGCYVHVMVSWQPTRGLSNAHGHHARYHQRPLWLNSSGD